MITDQGVAVPDDMAAALAANPAALTAFTAMRPARQREYVHWVGKAAGADERSSRLGELAAHVLADPGEPARD